MVYGKMTAVWLIILTIIVCGAVPTLMIYLTTIPHSEMSLFYYFVLKGIPSVDAGMGIA
jgi:hypothetical protein